ncbi:DUF4864 domain-containing protein [Notoacmeibacter sp. MSK16QG-6]|uniref:DUF4864 domain-containing protein n=1 Tax=Notoacmeibacter sp. MSK16QG-6 TaxID=2957982 RepID=UPI00209CF633|nr:DUF4864 domain-containing protein [Notoacmeibacter sp. MSK16QG-6]MCP1199322.1 DUF4864 domain-containing protein [Notoacmeibacter sp. MSK16QG-6]
MKPFALLIFAFSFVVLAAVSVSAQEPPPWQQTIDDQLRSFQSGDDVGAYAHAAPNVRSMYPTLEGFMAMVEGGYPQVRRPKSWKMGTATPLSESQIAQEVIIVGPDGKLWKALYMLQRQADGRWQISGVSLRGMKSFGV